MFGAVSSERATMSSAAVCPVTAKLILNFSEEKLRLLFAGLVIAAQRKKIADFLVKTFFGRPDFANALE